MVDIVYLILLLEIVFIVIMMAPALVGSSLLLRGQSTQALPWFRYYYFLSRFIPSWRGFSALNLCACYINLGDFVTALPLAEQAVREAQQRRQKGTLGLAHAYHALVLTRLGDLERAGEEIAAALAAPPNRRYKRGIAFYTAAYYINVGRIDEAAHLLEELRETRNTRTDTAYLAECNLSLCYFYQGDVETALRLARKAMKRTPRIPWLAVVPLYDAILYLIEADDIAGAEEIEAKLLTKLQGLPSHIASGAFRAIGRLALKKGELDRARDYAERACSLDHNPNAQADALLIQAEVFAARHNQHRAETLCGEILRLSAIDFYKRRAEALRRRLRGEDVEIMRPPVEQNVIVSQESAEQIARLENL